MMSRAEKRFCIRAQVAKAVAMLEHADHDTAIRTLADAMIALIELDEELPEHLANESISESIKRPMEQQERFVASLAEQKQLEAPTKIKRMEKK